MKNRRKIALKLCLIVLFFIVMLVLYRGAGKIEKAFFSDELEEVNKKFEEKEKEKVHYRGSWYEKKEYIETLLVMGIDHFEVSDENQES